MEFLMKILKLLIFFQLFFFAGCGRVIQCEYMTGAKEYNEFTETKYNGETDAQRRFSSYSIEKQIDIYLYARNCPDNPQIKQFLVNDGEKKIPSIVERIKATVKIWDKANLVGILSDINMECHCIKKDSDVIKTLENIEKKLDADKQIPNDYEYKKVYNLNLNFLKEQLDKQAK